MSSDTPSYVAPVVAVVVIVTVAVLIITIYCVKRNCYNSTATSGDVITANQGGYSNRTDGQIVQQNRQMPPVYAPMPSPYGAPPPYGGMAPSYSPVPPAYYQPGGLYPQQIPQGQVIAQGPMMGQPIYVESSPQQMVMGPPNLLPGQIQPGVIAQGTPGPQVMYAQGPPGPQVMYAQGPPMGMQGPPGSMVMQAPPNSQPSVHPPGAPNA